MGTMTVAISLGLKYYNIASQLVSTLKGLAITMLAVHVGPCTWTGFLKPQSCVWRCSVGSSPLQPAYGRKLLAVPHLILLLEALK
jgi:hypothetical protein